MLGGSVAINPETRISMSTPKIERNIEGREVLNSYYRRLLVMYITVTYCNVLRMFKRR